MYVCGILPLTAVCGSQIPTQITKGVLMPTHMLAQLQEWRVPGGQADLKRSPSNPSLCYCYSLASLTTARSPFRCPAASFTDACPSNYCWPLQKSFLPLVIAFQTLLLVCCSDRGKSGQDGLCQLQTPWMETQQMARVLCPLQHQCSSKTTIAFLWLICSSPWNLCTLKGVSIAPKCFCIILCPSVPHGCNQQEPPTPHLITQCVFQNVQVLETQEGMTVTTDLDISAS